MILSKDVKENNNELTKVNEVSNVIIMAWAHAIIILIKKNETIIKRLANKGK